MSKIKKQIGKQFTRALFDVATINVEKRTVDVVFATETPVLRRNWDIGEYNEVLVCEKANVRMDRLNAGAPVLDNHDRSSVTVQLGVVESATIGKGEGRATLRFSKREDVEGVWQDVQDGILRGVSVGYNVYSAELTETKGTLPTARCIDWEPFEISLAPVPADFKSSVRSEGENTHEVVIINHKKNSMTEAEKLARKAAILAATRAAKLDDAFAEGLIGDESINIDEARTAIISKLGETLPAPVIIVAPGADTRTAEQITKTATERASGILFATRAANLSAEFAQGLIDDSAISIEGARTAIILKMSENMSAANTRSASAVTVTGEDEAIKMRNAITAGLGLRSGTVKEKDLDASLVAGAREYRSSSLLDIAKMSLIRGGVSVKGMDKMEVAGRAITSSTSDFTVLLQDVINKTLLSNYQAVTDSWRKFCMTGSVNDFREHKRLRMGSFGRLDKIGENGEYLNKAIPDAEQQGIIATTFGNTINVSRKMLINDDLDGFARLASMLGRAAARSIEIDVYALLASNPMMKDGIALFDAAHGNLVTASAPSALTFDAMRVLMARQKDPSGNDFLDLRPSNLLIGIGQGGNARVINDALYDPDTANKLQKPNLAHGIFNNIIDTARITGNEFYAFAAPEEEPTIEVAFLDGMQEPFMEQTQSSGVDGVTWKVRLDYGVGAIGWRGVVKNVGV